MEAWIETLGLAAAKMEIHSSMIFISC